MVEGRKHRSVDEGHCCLLAADGFVLEWIWWLEVGRWLEWELEEVLKINGTKKGLPGCSRVSCWRPSEVCRRDDVASAATNQHIIECKLGRPTLDSCWIVDFRCLANYFRIV